MVEVDEWIKDRMTSYSVDRFIVIVNKARQETNRRIIQLQRDNPDNKHYQDADRYEMLSPLTQHTAELLEQTYEQYRVVRDKRRAEIQAQEPTKEVSVPELVEGLEAVGLNPIVIDEKTDFSKLPPLK
jgi:hypothetical protein